MYSRLKNIDEALQQLLMSPANCLMEVVNSRSQGRGGSESMQTCRDIPEEIPQWLRLRYGASRTTQ